MATDNGNSLSREDRLERDWRPQCGRCGFDSETGGFDPKRDVFVQRNPATDSPYWIHCPNPKCMGEPYGEEVILDRESGKTKRVPFPEKSESQEAVECFYETTKRPRTGSGGSSGSKGRKKPVKRDKARVEQEPVMFNGGSGGSIVVKRKVERYAEADQRVKLYIPEWFKKALKKEASQRSRMDNRKWSMIQVIRSAMWKHARNVEMVKPFEYGQGDRIELQILLYPDEKKLLDESCAAKDCSHGEFVAACVKEFSA